MNPKEHERTCTACGLVVVEPSQSDTFGSLLCSRCTLGGTTEPIFEVVVAAMALGYFMNNQQLDDPKDALTRAYDYVARLPFWQDHTLTPLDRWMTLTADMTTLDLDAARLDTPDFFISHSWVGPDEALVEPLVAALRDQGYRVWYDKDMWEKDVGKTQQWMERGIHQARHCIPILCQPYFESENCQFELRTILSKDEAQNNVFPVWWKDVDKSFLQGQELGREVLGIMGIGWTEWQGEIEVLVQKLLQRVRAAEKLQEYQGVPLVAMEARVLEKLGGIIQEAIPPLASQPSPEDTSLSLPTFGFSYENNRIIGLYLQDKRLSEIPSVLNQCTALQSLNLKNNPLTKLSTTLSQSLRKIITSHYPDLSEPEAIILFMLECQIGRTIPQVDWVEEDRFGFTAKENSITSLGLYNKSLISLPESFGHLTRLEKLWLHVNQLRTLPESFRQLTNLQVLNLAGNQFTTLPESFSDLKTLEKLWLNYNKLKSLPRSFGQLSSLQTLDLKRNQLNNLPESFGNLKNLVVLHLDGNKLNSLPESFGNLKNLVELPLYNNELKIFPDSFGHLSKLEKLWAYDNQLKTLPESFGHLKNLVELRLDSNELDSLPESFVNLKSLNYLDLRGNQLRDLPDSFFQLTNLQELNLAYNEFTSLSDSFFQLTNLQTLNLGGNPFTSLSDLFSNLRKLKTLYLDYSKLMSLPESFGDLINLQTLRLYSNRLEALPESFGQLTVLQSLNLGVNRLSSLPESFGQLTQLVELHLNNNQLKTLPEAFGNLVNLKTLYLYDNPLAASQSERDRIEQLLPTTCTVQWTP